MPLPPRVPTAAELGVDLTAIPEPVQRPVELAAQIVHGVQRVARWGETPCLVIALWKTHDSALVDDPDPEPAEVTASVQHLSPGVDGAFDPSRELRKMPVSGQLNVPSGKTFLGLGVLAEELTFDDTISSTDYWRGTPAEVAARHDDWVSSGRSKQARAVVAALSSGWRYQYSAPRHGKARIHVHAPGEQWTDNHELAVTVTEVMAALARTSVQRGARTGS